MQDNYTFRVLGIINIFLKFVTILQALLLRHWYEIMALYYINSILTETSASRLDKAPRLSISIVIWILSSDTICQLNQFNTNSEAAMLSILDKIEGFCKKAKSSESNSEHMGHATDI